MICTSHFKEVSGIKDTTSSKVPTVGIASLDGEVREDLREDGKINMIRLR